MASAGSSGGPKSEQPWKLVQTPFDVSLVDVERAADGTYAVGTSGTLVARTQSDWEVVFDHTAESGSETLHALAVTDDGQRLWFAGASGVVGLYDVDAGETRLYTIDGGKSSTWTDVGVFGASGSEHGLLADDSGEVVPFSVDGVNVDWGSPEKPGEGASVSALTMVSDGTGFAVDTAGNAYRRGYEGWDPLGTVNAQVTFTDIYAEPGDHVYVTARDGSLYRLAPDKTQWDHIGVANTGLVSIDVHQNHVVVLSAAGNVFRRHTGSSERWRRQSTPGGQDLLDVSLGYPDVIVGKDGAVLERAPNHRSAPDPKHADKVHTKQETKTDPKKVDSKKANPKKKKKEKTSSCRAVDEVVEVRIVEAECEPVEARRRERVAPRCRRERVEPRRRVVTEERCVPVSRRVEVVEPRERRRGRRRGRERGPREMEVVEVAEDARHRRC